MSPVFDWSFEAAASDEIIDLYFIYSDMADIELSDMELYESAQYDALTNAALGEQNREGFVPLGKQVY
jgi:hypothetical protein